MPRWDLVITLDRSGGSPLYLQIVRAISEDICRGRLLPGTRLPGSRTLAQKLGLNRNTVLAAYDELTAEGWLTSSSTKGTFVSKSFLELQVQNGRSLIKPPSTPMESVAYELKPASMLAKSSGAYPPGTLDLSSGSPDLHSISLETLSRAYRRVLSIDYRRLLGYCQPEGHAMLREELAAMVSATRSLPATAENILITRGSQMAWTLLSHVLLGPGDVIAVEELGYRPAWEAFRQSGAKIVPIPMDDQGIRVDAVEELSSRSQLRALYLTPHHQYPTTVTLSAPRRLQLLHLAASQRFALIEDDYDHEFQYVGHPVMPMASLDHHGTVIYVSTLSKVLAPGLRIGFIVAPRQVIKILAAYRVVVDLQGDHVLESAIGHLLADGEIQRHINRVRRVYEARRNVLTDCLRSFLGSVVEFDPPTGGLALWAKVSPEVDVDHWAERSIEHGVAFHTGRRYSFDGLARPFVRLSFASLGEQQLKEAVRRMASSLPRTDNGRPAEFK